MNVEIIETPIRFHLHGIGGVVENERYGEVGLRLMNEMWQVVKGAGIPTTGINHGVYLPDGRMFVGLQLQNPQQVPTPHQLEPLEFELQRYMKHLHIGPYQALPQKWKELKAELAARGEAIGTPLRTVILGTARENSRVVSVKEPNYPFARPDRQLCCQVHSYL